MWHLKLHSPRIASSIRKRFSYYNQPFHGWKIQKSRNLGHPPVRHQSCARILFPNKIFRDQRLHISLPLASHGIIFHQLRYLWNFRGPISPPKSCNFWGFQVVSCEVVSESDQKSKPPALLVELQLEMWKESFLWRLRSDKYNNYIYMYVYIQCWLLSYTVAVAVAIRILTILVGNLY